MVVMLQDAVGVGHHAANLIFSTTSSGSSGVLQDWLIIDSTGLATCRGNHNAPFSSCQMQQEKKRKDYAFRRQFNEKPSIMPGCPGPIAAMTAAVGKH